jgi:hypothetical protein
MGQSTDHYPYGPGGFRLRHTPAFDEVVDAAREMNGAELSCAHRKSFTRKNENPEVRNIVRIPDLSSSAHKSLIARDKQYLTKLGTQSVLSLRVGTNVTLLLKLNHAQIYSRSLLSP